MHDKIKEQFPWMPSVLGHFSEKYNGNYGIETLERLQRNITEEIKKLECNWKLQTAILLLEGVEFFHFHFSRIRSFENKDFPTYFTFSSEMEGTWSHVYSSFFKICLLLSRGKKESEWIDYAKKEIRRFQGERNILFDALLLLGPLDEIYKPVYGAMFQDIFENMKTSIPAKFDDPAKFLKWHLLFRRLQRTIPFDDERNDLNLKVSQTKAPEALWDWFFQNGFTVPWTRKEFKKVHLGTDICKKLAAQFECKKNLVNKLLKTLLPTLCTQNISSKLAMKKRQRGKALANAGRKLLQKRVEEDSCLGKDNMEAKGGSAGGRKWPETDSEGDQKDCVGSRDAVGEPKSKKRRGNEFSAEKNPDNGTQIMPETVDSESVHVSSERLDLQKIENNIRIEIKCEPPEENFASDSSLPDKIISEELSVKKEIDDTNNDMHTPPENIYIDTKPKSQETGLLFDVGSPILKTEGSPKESMQQNINIGDLASTINGLSERHLSKFTSSAVNEKPAECVSFLDISAGNVGSHDENCSFVYHTPESSEFSQYRDSSYDQDNNVSDDGCSETKSVEEADLSEYPSDTSKDTEGEESNSSPRGDNSPDAVPNSPNYETCVVKTEPCCNAIQDQGNEFSPNTVPNSPNYETYVVKTEPCCTAIQEQQFRREEDGSVFDTQRSQGIPTQTDTSDFVKIEGSQDDSIQRQHFWEEDEHGTSISVGNQQDISTQTMPMKIWMLNPVVNLGERCDSFKGRISSVSPDSISSPTNSSVLPDIKAGNEEANEKEVHLIANQNLTVSDEDEEFVESTQNGGEHLPSLGITLRKRPAAVVQNEKPMSDDEGSRQMNKDTPENHHMILRRRNPSSSSSQGKSDEDSGASATQCITLNNKSPSSSRRDTPSGEYSSVSQQGTPATHRMILRTRHPSPPSSQEKSAPADEVFNQTTPINRRTRHPSSPSSQDKSVPADEVLNYTTTTATGSINLRGRIVSSSSNQGVKRRSPTVTTRSSKRLKQEVNLNLRSQFRELTLNSPKTQRRKSNNSSCESHSEVVKGSPTSRRENPSRRSTRTSASGTSIKEKANDSEGYRLRPRKSVIMPGKL